MHHLTFWTWIIARIIIIINSMIYGILKIQADNKDSTVKKASGYNTRVLRFYPIGGNFLLNLFCSSPRKPLLTTLPTMYNLGTIK